ncbi:MAG: lipopolysaccharide biosynthesis protein [Terriglobia bacterium]
MDHGSKRKIARGVAWAGASNWGSQLLSFCIYTGLARLLNPQAFGLVAIAGIYLAFIQVLVSQGFGMAIIQRRELEEEHLDSAFWIAVATAAFFCLLSLLLAGRLANFFHEPRVAPVIGWLSLSLLLCSLSSVPTAILTRELNFRALAVRSLAGTAAGGVVGLAMAFLGWGAWSLVGQQLVNAFLGCICLWWAVPWRPRFQVSRRHLRDLYVFSLSLTGNDILWFFSQRSDQTLVGYGFGPVGLGPYALASRINNLLVDAVNLPLQSVAFPAFAKLQSAQPRFERALCRFCEMSSFVALPAFAGIIVVAPELVPWLFGAKWASAVPILQILAGYGALRVALAFVHPTMLAKGRTGLYLALFILQALLTFVGCLVAVRWSPAAIALSMVLTMAVFGAFEAILVAVKVVEISPAALLRSFSFPALSTLFMVGVVAVVRALASKYCASTLTMAVCVAAGASVYTLTACYFRPDLVKEIRDMLAHVWSPLERRGPEDGGSQLPNRVEGSGLELSGD